MNQTIELKAHQIDGIGAIKKAFCNGKSFLLADEVGVMKTRQACFVAKDYFRTLIVAPLSTFTGWEREAKAVGLQLRIADIHFPPSNAVLINYEKLDKYKDIGEWTEDHKLFIAQEFDLIIWDEAHALKNPKSKRSRIFNALDKKCKKALLLTATPGQSPLDLHYLKGVVPFNNFWPWVRSFQGVFEKKWGGLDFRRSHQHDIDRLKGIVEGNARAIRRTPQDIAGWPELNRVMFPIKLTPKQAETYNEAMESYLHTLDNNKRYGVMKAYDMVAVGQFRKTLSELKCESTIALAQNLIDQGKIITISCDYLDSVRRISEALEEGGVRIGIITGDTIAEKRKQVLELSMTDALQAIVFTVREGINLQQPQNSTIERIQIDHDIRWSALQQHQIDGRTHRSGMNALVYWMIVGDTVDERVASVLKKRMEVMKDIQGEEIDPTPYLFGIPKQEELTLKT